MRADRSQTMSRAKRGAKFSAVGLTVGAAGLFSMALLEPQLAPWFVGLGALCVLGSGAMLRRMRSRDAHPAIASSERVDQVNVAARVVHGAAGDFYVADRQCLLCMNPLHAAPELMGYFDAPEGPAGSTCFFARQPSTAAEVDTAIRAIETACCGALRYGGNDPTILGKLAALGLADRCDATDKGPRGRA